MTREEIAKALWVEYLRVHNDEWGLPIPDSEKHAAKTAIRCCATRLGVYVEFCALDKPEQREVLITRLLGV